MEPRRAENIAKNRPQRPRASNQMGNPDLHPSRVLEVDLLKGWAILGVIFLHMSFASRFGSNVMAAINGIQHYVAWAVVAFFFCAGFLFARNSGVTEPIRDYLPKRARRLLVPWVAFSLLNKVLLMAGHRMHVVTAPIPIESQASLCRQILQFIMWPGGPQLYFLPALFAISIFFRLICNVARQEWALWLLALLLIAGYVWLNPGAPYGGEIAKYPAFAATYLFGILIARPVFLTPIRRRIFFPTVVAVCFGALCIARPVAVTSVSGKTARPIHSNRLRRSLTPERSTSLKEVSSAWVANSLGRPVKGLPDARAYCISGRGRG